jgi:3-hydroxyacyl-CoA dehydrogenase
MTRFEQPRVAVLGAGAVGSGWATLTVAAGWAVALYDPDQSRMAEGFDALPERVGGLVALGRAHPEYANRGLAALRIGRSLLQAVTDADWIIEATGDELAPKQRLLEQLEQVTRRAAIVTSSSSRHHASVLAARLRRPERLLALHPLIPVELMPTVEVVPGPATDPTCVEDVRFWLGLLGRTPVVLKKEFPGDAAGRIHAAVLRECIQLVLEGVLDVEDVDRALAHGLALTFASGGIFRSLLLNGPGFEVDPIISRAMTGAEEGWAALATWQQLSPEEQRRVIRGVEKAYGAATIEARNERDRRLRELLIAIQVSEAEPTT